MIAKLKYAEVYYCNSYKTTMYSDCKNITSTNKKSLQILILFWKKLQKAKNPRYTIIQLDMNLATTTQPEFALSKHQQP